MTERFARNGQVGFGLVELMVALVLGLIVVGGAISVFASNRQAFRTTEGLSRLQENARIGFEIMTRDVRDAAGTPCSKNIPVANVVIGAAGNWMYDWGNGLQGFESGQPVASLPALGFGSRVAGTDAIVLHSGGATGVTIAEHQPNAAAANFKVNTVDHALAPGDLVIVCDYRQATILQVTNANSANVTIVHNTGGSVTPGNCSKGLGFPTQCANPGNRYTYAPNSILAKLTSVAWYVGENRRGGRSLFRMRGGAAQPEEIVDGVTNLQMSYLVPGAAGYADANLVGANWPNVNAVRIAFTAASPEAVGTGGQVVSRQVVHYAALRNRNL